MVRIYTPSGTISLSSIKELPLVPLTRVTVKLQFEDGTIQEVPLDIIGVEETPDSTN